MRQGHSKTKFEKQNEVEENKNYKQHVTQSRHLTYDTG